MTDDMLRIKYAECDTSGCDFKGVWISGLEADPDAPDLARHTEESGHEDRWNSFDRVIPWSLINSARDSANI